MPSNVTSDVNAEIGEDYSFAWSLAGLDEYDLRHLRDAVQRYFRHVANEAVGDANDIRFHVVRVQRIGDLVAAIEVVEKARAEATAAQSKWRDAKRHADYRREQEAMREKARVAARRTPAGEGE